ncbi:MULTISPECIES: VWA domain-containing protein [Acidobacteriaceae]|uniref:VWA domain-containing protein n=1 Tax=Acidobacteriaceae TaxID=204434 RepID=UPI0020B15379|nr:MULTISPECIES: VWA domain-containing protein [Acidobacteriaceae]MDW5267853.1 VWA domain-containing protein [Edaphobacter sp.]
MMLAQQAQQTAAQDQAPQTVAQQTAAQQQAIPDAPRPQQPSPFNAVAPGKGTPADLDNSTSSDDDAGAPPSSLPQTAAEKAAQGTPPEVPAAGQGAEAFTLHVQTNFVEVPFTVKDSKQRLVPGLTWRDVHVYENGLRQQMALFTTDAFPLSVALVIDQSMTYDNMTKVNNALDALPGAFAAYDEVAVFTYNNGPRMQTDFTAAQSARLSAVIERSKSTGREGAMAYTSGPLSQNINLNGGAQSYIDPNTNSTHGTSLSNTLNVPKEVHTLNDAILAAANHLAKTRPGRRRVIYVISDGKEYGSTASFKEVVKYLQTNKIAVYGTLVGDSSLPVVGFLDRIHLPLTMRDNVLQAYAKQTGGNFEAEFRQRGIEDSFARIAEEVRTQYTIGYYTHEPFIDSKYRTLEVKILRPNLTVIAKAGYYPSAEDTKPSIVRAK